MMKECQFQAVSVIVTSNFLLSFEAYCAHVIASTNRLLIHIMIREYKQ